MADRIHHEIDIDAEPAAVYRALTDAERFAQMTGNRAASIDPVAGGAFSLFDGMITGRNIELEPDRLLVQAWHSGHWGAGVYSIARFELSPRGKATRILFDHAGFPEDQKSNLETGWHANYWEPLKAFLT